jgi:hypothetical protein
MLQATLLIGVSILAVSCGEDGPSIPSEVPISGGQTTDSGQRPDVELDGGFVDTADTVQPSGTCDLANEDLGTLATNGGATVVSRTLDVLGGSPMSCAFSGEGSGEGRGAYIFAFEVAEVAILKMSVSASTTDPLSFGLFEGSCVEDAESYCSRQSPWRTVVEPGTRYFLKVQAGDDTVNNTFNASFGFEEAACIPGETTCSESTSNRCVQGTSVETYSCAGECSDAESCAGDACETALMVEPVVGGEPVSIQGHRWAYTHQWNAAELSNCEASGAIGTGGTTDMELFVRVPGLEVGQTLDVSHPSDAGSYLYFVLDDCAASSCRAAGFVDEATEENRLVWDVPEDGDYLVVIEALSSTSRPFQMDISLR